ncbi:hypothetical protein Rhopal_002855-T1 [Rhodotorula paludigena]|uniref:Alcohol acetyltransferase n=1 Tax=Rhodotorula paludigena TaxID=86838 RepID=A0AAV5GB99_9BASI|nr:hypothetical protein Rhopal_002855-T1 [Rhodotorula paludigena]
MASERALGLYERYSLARSQAGVAPVVAFTATLPADKIDAQALSAAVAQLLARYPLLSCTVADIATVKPRYVRAEAIKPDDIFVEDAEVGGTVTEALLEALQAGASIDVVKGPLWRVKLAGADVQGRRRVSLTAHHVLSDGSSTRNLFAELLALSRQTSESQSAPTAFPPSLEESVDVRPSSWTMVKVVYSELLAPKLPAFLRPATPTFFPNPPLAPPFEQQTALKHLSLPASLVDGLKSIGKSHNIATLHPVLYISALAALSSTLAGESSTAPHLVGDSPISLRSASAGHPTCTGNYVSSISTPHPALSPSSERFWPACAEYAKRLADPAARKAALEGMGMLAYVPDGLDPSRAGKTKFDAWLEDGLRKAEPWSASFEVSNLGVLPATGWEGDEGLEDVAWAQAGMCIGPALTINPVAVRGGNLAVTLTYRQNAIDEETVSAFWTAFERVLRRAAEGQLAQDATFAQASEE